MALKLGSNTRTIPIKRKKKTPLVARTTFRSDDEPKHHFFASSLGRWLVSYDLESLIRRMKLDDMPFNLYLVPGGIDQGYPIESFAPQVAGAQWLAFYEFEKIKD